MRKSPDNLGHRAVGNVNYSVAALNFASAIPVIGSAFTVAKWGAKATKVASKLKYADEAMDLMRVASKGAQYSNRAAQVRATLKLAGKLLNDIPGVCKLGKFLAQQSKAGKAIVDLLDIGCFEAGTTVKTKPLDECDLASLDERLLAGRGKWFVLAVATGITAALASRHLLKKRGRKRAEQALDEVFAQWNDEVLSAEGLIPDPITTCSQDSCDDRVFGQIDGWLQQEPADDLFIKQQPLMTRRS
jgi:hypothetical protein